MAAKKKTKSRVKKKAASKVRAKKSIGVRTGKSAARSKVAKKRATKRTASAGPQKDSDKKWGTRADFGKPIEGFFAKQPANLRAILEALRELANEAAPDATTALKWGMPFYSIDGAMMCALGAHKAHVNLILTGPPDAFPDPKGRLSGEGKTGRHLKLTSIDELPRAEVRQWLKIAAERARKG